MKSVLELVGFFLFLGYKVVMLPIVSVLGILLGVVIFFNYTNALWKKLPLLMHKTAALLPVYKHKFRFSHKWQIGLLSK